MEYCCHVWADAPNCYLSVLGLSFSYCLSGTRRLLSTGMIEMVSSPYHSERPTLVDLIGCMIFLSPFLEIKKFFMSPTSFLTGLGSGTLYLQNAFLFPFFVFSNQLSIILFIFVLFLFL